MVYHHHAYLLIDPEGGKVAGLRAELGERDIFYEERENFGIDDARRLRALERRSVGDLSHRYFILQVQAITLEAQNALLKMLEEPAANTHFFISLPSLEVILPTLRSRCEIVNSPDSPELKYLSLAEEFLKALPEQRLSLAEKLESRYEAIAFANALEVLIEKSERGAKEKLAALERIKKARSYLHDRAALPKLILEHLALVL